MQFGIVWNYRCRADPLPLQLPLLFGLVVEMWRAALIDCPQRAVPPHRDVGRRAEGKFGRNCTELGPCWPDLNQWRRGRIRHAAELPRAGAASSGLPNASDARARRASGTAVEPKFWVPDCGTGAATQDGCHARARSAASYSQPKPSIECAIVRPRYRVWRGQPGPGVPSRKAGGKFGKPAETVCRKCPGLAV